MYETQKINLANRIKVDRDEIIGKLALGQAQKRKEQDEAISEIKFLEDFQNSISSTKQYDKIASYMKSITKDGVEIVDPTGRTPKLYPSKITAVKTMAFGLGQKQIDPNILSREMKKYPNAGIFVNFC